MSENIYHCARCGFSEASPSGDRCNYCDGPGLRPSGRVIVSRHPAAVEFIARALGGVAGHRTADGAFYPPSSPTRPANEVCIAPDDPERYPDTLAESVPVIASATPEQVRGRMVFGNLPLHLAALAELVVAVEFAGAPPRGQEYTLADMDQAGARLVRYQVRLGAV